MSKARELSQLGSNVDVDRVSGNLTLKNNLLFEGATDDAFETTLTVVDPTAAREITFPDSTGTVVLSSTISNYISSGGSGVTASEAIAYAIALG